MLTTCSEPGCTTLVMGGRCLEHERHPTRVFVRGRPLVAAPRTDATGYAEGPLAVTRAIPTFDRQSEADVAVELPPRG
jgi:hypothetical protein